MMTAHPGPLLPLLLALLPALAGAQTAAAPRVEAGGHAGVLSANAHVFTAGPRLTFNFTSDTALEAGAEFQRQSLPAGQSGYFAAELYHVQMRRLLWRQRDLKVSGLVGAGAGYRHHRFVARPDRGDTVFPETEFRLPAHAFLAGLSTEVTVSPRLALRVDTQLVLGQSAGLRLVGGASVPLGRLPQWRESGSTATTDLGRRLPAGQRAWVTLGDGLQYEGQVRRADGQTVALVIPEGDVTLALSDVRRIEVPDSIGNGAAWGGIAGGAATGTFAAVVVAAFCEGGDDCASNATRFVLATAAVGAGLGALGGAIVDSFIDGRRVVYERGGGPVTMRLAPLFVKGGGGVVGRIGWAGSGHDLRDP